MKIATVFLATACGGLIGGALVHVATRSTTPVTETPSAVVEEVEHMRHANVELTERLEQLEATPAALRLEPSSTGGVVLHPALEDALRPLVREIARSEIGAATTADGSDTSQLGPREVVLARALGQLSAPHEDTRMSAIRSLHRMFAAEASDQVLPMLEDESALVRREAAAYFEDMWDPAAFEPLVAMMNGGDASVSEQALDALCKSGMEEAIVELENCFLENEDLDLAYEAGKALEENRRPDVLPRGVQRFRSAMTSQNADQRRMGAQGVGRWGSAGIDEARMRSLLGDADSRVRRAAERALERWGLTPGG